MKHSRSICSNLKYSRSSHCIVFMYVCLCRNLSALYVLCRNLEVQLLIGTHFKLWTNWMMKTELPNEEQMYLALGLKNKDKLEEQETEGRRCGVSSSSEP
jgi:hypothetical protein